MVVFSSNHPGFGWVRVGIVAELVAMITCFLRPFASLIASAG
jgi:hypothetical protein